MSDPIEITMYIIEILGCVSFATSGAITAIRRNTDYLGVIILSLIEIFGGGLLRDIFMGPETHRIPHIFSDPSYFLMALVGIMVATIWFLLGYFRKTASIIEKHRHDFLIYASDALGIAVFCIAGVKEAQMILVQYQMNSPISEFIFLVSMGVITGTGGGMFRDVFIGKIPMIFKKHFYMTPCIIGCIVYTAMYKLNINTLLSMLIGILVIVALRILATIFKWNLPTCKGYDELVKTSEKNQENK